MASTSKNTPKINGPAIGIDLGTTYSCVGVLHNGEIQIIVNGQGNRTTPSYVAFTDTDRLVGESAKNKCFSNPTNTIFGAKRLLGRSFNDLSVKKHVKNFPFKVVSGGTTGKPTIVVNFKGQEKLFVPEEISSMVLAHMRDIAETFLEKTVKNAVVTVPAYFNDTQRRATMDAGRIAGLNVMRVINEPIAAAIAYRLESAGKDKKNVLIFDLGGGTFDVSILEMEGDVLEVKTIAGDADLGGEDFDNRMVYHFVQEFRRKHNMDITSNPKALSRLRANCEKAKLLQQYFSGKKLCHTVNPDEAVAHGATILASKLVGDGSDRVKELVLLDVTPLSLGINVAGCIMSVVIPRNTPIPVVKSHVYCTAFDNQSSAGIDVYEGERSLVADNNLLGKFDLIGIPPAPAGAAKCNVSFEIDADGILTVTAELIGTHLKKKITIVNERGRLNEQEIQRLVEDANRYRLEDEARKEKAKSRSDFETLLYNLTHRLRVKDYIPPEKKHKIKNAIKNKERWLQRRKEIAETFEFVHMKSQLEKMWEDLSSTNFHRPIHSDYSDQDDYY